MLSMKDNFPPPPEAQVTLANWRVSPFNKWGFQHVREIVPSADIANDPDNLWHLPPADADLSSLAIDDGAGGRIHLDDFLTRTQTDAFVVIHRGQVKCERYANGMAPETPHILMSVSKSMLGLLAGALIAHGVLDPDAPAEHYLPELRGSAFQGAMLHQLLDMRSALAFDEDYLATSGPIVQYRKATNWNPLSPGEAPTDLRAFLPTLAETRGLHGGAFNYVSPCTDLIGWIIERATGQRFADLFSQRIWRPLGAVNPGYITVDRLGAPRCAGGMCMTAMDLARVGQLLVGDGRRGGRQIVPSDWIDDISTAGDPDAWRAGPFLPFFPGREMHYRAKWYVERGKNPVLSGFGIHGQHLFVDRARQIVVVKFSSQALPLDGDAIRMTYRTVDALREMLSESDVE